MKLPDSEGWIVSRLQVRLAGRVTAPDGEPASSGTLTLSPLRGPGGSRGGGRGRAKSNRIEFAPQFDTAIRGDGLYFFVDLPPGEYRLEGEDERGNQIGPRNVTVLAKQLGSRDIVALDLKASTRSGSEERMDVDPTSSPRTRPRRSRRGRAGERQE